MKDILQNYYKDSLYYKYENEINENEVNENYKMNHKNRFNPYVMNGGTVAAVAGADFSILASDTRISEGYMIHKRNFCKMEKVSDKVGWALGGFQGDADMVKRVTRMTRTEYKLDYGMDLSCESYVQSLANLMYSRRGFPYYTNTVVAGIDKQGAGCVYSFDPVGSHEREPYRVMGSADTIVQPLFDNQFGRRNFAQNNVPYFEQLQVSQSVDEALKIVVDGFNAAAERDIYTGDGLDLLIFRNGQPAEQQFVKMRHD